MRPLHRRRRRAGRRTATDEDGYLRIRLAGCDEDKQTVASARPVDAPSPPRSLARGRRASCTPCQPSSACRRCRAPRPPRLCLRVSSRLLVQPQRVRVRLRLRLGAVKHQEGLERLLRDRANEPAGVRAKGERRALIAVVVHGRTADPRLHQDVPHVGRRDADWRLLSLPAAELKPDCLGDGVEHGLVDTDDRHRHSEQQRCDHTALGSARAGS
mmetsp:Transcript_13993/g.35672  ORF Transcript_13993/g.35672 Transcript_13993/m.35672 type:complete len:214 (+) Transcript_13993:47-688(+)